MEIYEVTKYEGSIACASVMSATLEQLTEKRRYYEMAVLAHTDEGQIKFFTDGLNLVNTRIEKLSGRS